jgi:hypothetical protein
VNVARAYSARGFNNCFAKESVMIIDLGKVTVTTKAILPNGTILDPLPIPRGKRYYLGRII